MKKIFIFAVLILVTLNVSFADDRASVVDRALTKVQEVKAEAQTWEGKNSDQPYLPLLNEYETKINADWSYEETYHTRVKIQKESAKDLGEWPIYYNKSREDIVEIKAFVETPEGKKIASTNIQDVSAYESLSMYSDMKVKIITMPQVNIGNVIDVTVKSKTSRSEIADHFWDEIPYPVVPTKYARHTFIFPENKTIAFKSYKKDIKPLIEKKNGTVKYSFVFQETESLKDEELTPPADEVNGGLYLSSIDDWKVIADWYRVLVNKNTVDKADITVKALELVKDKTSQKDKARVILEFMQDNFRYVAMNFGDHTVEPHPTDEIFKNRYGDCKDLVLLTRQMLKIAGVYSDIVLMNSEYTGNPQNALPNPSIFEHVVLEIELDGKKYFVDPQIKGFDFGELPSNYDNANVFVITETSYRFDHLPIGEPESRAMISTGDVELSADGSALFTVHVKLPLEASQEFRSQWASTTDQNKNKFFEGLEANFAQGGTMLSHDVKGLENRYGPLEFELKYQSPTAYPIVNDMLLLKEADQGDIPEFAAKDRVFPIFFSNNYLIKNTNVYHVPDGFNVDFVPSNYKLEIDFASISADYANAGDKVTVNTTYRLKRARIEPQRYADVKKFRQELYKKNDQYIVLKKKSQASNEAKDWIKNQ